MNDQQSARNSFIYKARSLSKYIYLASSLLLINIIATGCRSQADEMAEFCLRYERITQTDDCAEMAHGIINLLDAEQPVLSDESICLKTTACLPCRKAVADMMRGCGGDRALRPALDRMHFSATLREQLFEAEKEPSIFDTLLNL